MFSSMKSIRNRRVIPISGGFRDRMTAFGRKRPLKIDQIPTSERPLLGKADITLLFPQRSKYRQIFIGPNDRFTPESGRSPDMLVTGRL